ncbi:MAG: hypothetical protein NC390_00585 [Fusobacterium sp.]|nr:hypothetical protein [Fusobacterium sp.]
MGNVSAIVHLVKGATHAKPAAKVGANMAKCIGRTTRQSGGYLEMFNGTKQVLNGQSIVKGNIKTVAPKGVYNSTPDKYLTKISTQTQNGSKEVSRIIPYKENNFTAYGDITKVTTNEMAQVGAHRVNTFNQVSYEYGNRGLEIQERTIDRVFAGKKHLGGRAVLRNIGENSTRANSGYQKVYFGADGVPLKTVHVNAQGIRTHAVLPDGRIIAYDAKGMPLPTDAIRGEAMNLGGLDRLI